MTSEQANKIKNDDIVIDTKDNKKLKICFRRSEEFFECAYLAPEYGWCNRRYQDLEIINK